MMKLDFDNNKMKNVAINEKPIRQLYNGALKLTKIAAKLYALLAI